MGRPVGADVIRLPNGKTMTLSRARGLGYLDRDGNIRPEVAARMSGGSPAESKARREAREAAWRKQQGLEPETTEDGRLKPVRKPRPLRPKNVTKTGAPIEDEAELAAIAARTKAIEAEKAAARAAKE